jgi:hypothetical protein
LGPLDARLSGSAVPNAAQTQAQNSELSVQRVLVMFKCHFDVGFVDTQAAIIRKYFEQYFPQATDRRGAVRLDNRVLAAL